MAKRKSSALRKTQSSSSGANGSSRLVPLQGGKGPRNMGVPQIDISDHFSKSQGAASQHRVPLSRLRAFADAPPAYAAISRIADGVASIPWTVSPPKEYADNEEAIQFAQDITAALRRPNYDIDNDNLYDLFLQNIITDLLIGNVSAIERNKGLPKGQPFVLRVIDPERIQKNLDWDPSVSGVIPRYFDTAYSQSPDQWIPLLDEDLFIIKRTSNSWRSSPKSPLEIAFGLIAAWLGLFEFQQSTTTKAYNDYLIDIGPADEDELQAFRDFFLTEVIGRKRVPIFGSAGDSRGISVVKIGAASDEGLYLKYHEVILRIIALSFKLSARDLNLTDHDNRATSDVSENSTFRFAIKPMADIIFEYLQYEVIDFFAPGFLINQGNSQARDPLKDAEIAEKLFTSNVISRNEARLDVGKENMGSIGDVFSDGSRLDDEIEDEEEIDEAPGQNGSRNGKSGNGQAADNDLEVEPELNGNGSGNKNGKSVDQNGQNGRASRNSGIKKEGVLPGRKR